MKFDLEKIFKEINVNADNVKTDSRKVKQGDIFVAIKGVNNDGHDYCREAIENGAVCLICSDIRKDLSEEAKRKIVIVKDPRETLGEISKKIFKDPSSSLFTYGVTGTNGKTTTVLLIDKILNNADIASGLISTVFIKSGKDELQKAAMTTPDNFTLNRLLGEMVSSGREAGVIEVSSHALSQKRIWGIKLDGAVITNITREHLDYHGNMKNYFNEKCRIFDYLKKEGKAAINLDDPMVRTLKDGKMLKRISSFAIKAKADFMAKNISLSWGGTAFDLEKNDGKIYPVRTSLVGEHNVYNVLGAIAVLSGSTLSIERILEGVEGEIRIPGRLDVVPSDAPFKVFIDYAHTPGALENVLTCLRKLVSGKLICVIGCGGDRDRTKRPEMGRLATDLCDKVFFTNDNPRTEPPQGILREMEKGVANKDNYSIIEPRDKAIYEAMRSANEGDIVLIAGKGHEDYQIVGDEVLPFDDKKVATDLLKEMGYKALL